MFGLAALGEALFTAVPAALAKAPFAGADLPFPGVGQVAKAATGCAYVPIQWGADL